MTQHVLGELQFWVHTKSTANRTAGSTENAKYAITNQNFGCVKHLEPPYLINVMVLNVVKLFQFLSRLCKNPILKYAVVSPVMN